MLVRPWFRLDTLQRRSATYLFWLSLVVLLGFNLWATYTLYIVQRDGI